MPELDARIHAGEKVVEGKLTGSWPKLQTVPDVRLAPGDRVGSLEVVASPGHTPGHVAFLDTRDRTLIAGDVFTSYGRSRSPTTSTCASRSRRWRPWTSAQDLQSARDAARARPGAAGRRSRPGDVAAPGAAMDAAIARASR